MAKVLNEWSRKMVRAEPDNIRRRMERERRKAERPPIIRRSRNFINQMVQEDRRTTLKLLEVHSSVHMALRGALSMNIVENRKHGMKTSQVTNTQKVEDVSAGSVMETIFWDIHGVWCDCECECMS
ncbi:hypothetical protein PR048_005434 [Dryococelus australis]|uniref:Uncharacterized protein n=1 Tax=Dryococelus australis TaxID=614101 RepID=A0ABQ9IAC8_9NEOP|nr:hypothetical protein PR048_005434 [Dryococelus australis]